MGYRPAEEYAGGLTLGTCMSISGAAANPNWGYHSSPITSFLMTLFNIRLGVWLGNPNSERHWKSTIPAKASRISCGRRWAYRRTGRTTSTFLMAGISRIRPLRDGAPTLPDHRGGCRAGRGLCLRRSRNALRKIAIDLDAEIELTRIDMPKGDADPTAPGTFCAVGEIIYWERRDQYKAGTDRPGTLIYIKPGLHKPLPADVRSYAAANAEFPHDPTPNQSFTESQFESYRALGCHVVRMITCGRGPDGRVDRVDEHRPLRLLTFVRKARSCWPCATSKGAIAPSSPPCCTRMFHALIMSRPLAFSASKQAGHSRRFCQGSCQLGDLPGRAPLVGSGSGGARDLGWIAWTAARRR